MFILTPPTIINNKVLIKMLDDIMLFINLVEIQSFTKVAEKLRLQPSTISKRISLLEQELGDILLKRDTRNISITEYGRFIYDKFSYLPNYISDVLSTKNLRLLMAKSNTLETSGKLNIRLGGMILIERILPKLSVFTKMFPNVKLNIRVARNYAKWRDDGTNIMLMPHDIQEKSLVSRFITTEYYRLFCTAQYAAKYGIPKTIDELYNHQVVGGIDGNTDEEINFVIMKNMCTQQELPLNTGNFQIKINSPLHAKEIGLGSEFIFYCWNNLCQEELLQKKIIPVLPEWYFYHLDYYVVCKKQITYIEQMFVEFICTCFSA